MKSYVAAPAAAALLAATGLAGPAHAAGLPGPAHAVTAPTTGLVVTDVHAAGDTCGPINVRVEPAADGAHVEVVYSHFVATAGWVPMHDGTAAWVPRDDNGCRTSFTLAYRAGWRVAVRGGDAFTFADLARGARGTIRVTHRWDAAPAAEVSRTVDGPVAQGETLRHEVSAPAYTDCGAPVRVVMAKDLTVEAGTAARDSTSELAADTTGLHPHDRVHLRWERC